MIQLFPPLEEPGADHELNPTEAMVAIASEHRPALPDRPWVYTNMIASTDGATAIGGLSGELGSEGDRVLFRALRGVADVIVAGAATVRKERYRPPRTHPELAELRKRWGVLERPSLAVVTRSLDLDPDLPLFNDPDHRPFVLTTTGAPGDRLRRLGERAVIIQSGDQDVDLVGAMQILHGHGVHRVLCEGGPSLNGQMVAAGLVDEWNLSVAPLTVGGESPRAAVGPLPSGPPPQLRLRRVWLHEDYLFCRWVRPDH